MFRKKLKRYPRGVNFGPVIGGIPAHAVNFFCYDKFPVTRKKSIFREISKFYFREVDQGTVAKKIFPDGPWPSPYNERKNLAPTPENLAKMGVKFLGVEQFQFHGAIFRGRLKSGKVVY